MWVFVLFVVLFFGFAFVFIRILVSRSKTRLTVLVRTFAKYKK